MGDNEETLFSVNKAYHNKNKRVIFFNVVIAAALIPCVCALQKKRGDSSTRAEAAKLTNTLLEASKSAPKITGKIVNDYGQEEVVEFSDCSRPP